MLINNFQVCDADMQILSVDASHGGATHDSFIWASHPLKPHLEELSNRESIWFLGVYNFYHSAFFMKSLATTFFYWANGENLRYDESRPRRKT